MACTDPSQPLSRIWVSGDSVWLRAVPGSVPDDSIGGVGAPPMDPLWVGLPLLKVETGFLRVVSDLRSDFRRIERWDARGQHVASTLVEFPFGLVASDRAGRMLVGVREAAGRFELALFEFVPPEGS
jgi:hypothetical protein